jgi:hypothetical protein
MEVEMRTIIVAAAASLFVATAPAFAQSYNPEVTTTVAGSANTQVHRH